MSGLQSVSPDALRQQLRYLQDAIAQNKTLLTTVAATAAQASTDAATALAAATSITILQTEAVPPSAAPTGNILFYNDTSGPTLYVWSANDTTWYEIPKGGSIVIP